MILSDHRGCIKIIMDMSHPAVHPVGVPPAVRDAHPRFGMKHLQGMPGTKGSLLLRLLQFCFAVVSFSMMLSIQDFSTVTAFCYLVAAMALQSVWSLALAITDAYGLLLQRTFRDSLLVSVFVVGDWVTSTLSLAAACASAGITVLIDNDLNECGPNHCGKYEAAVAMTFLTWALASISFFLTFWLLATR
ncbi:hypothetical protein O6H91_16G030100 [Diphasiastrum complanatum]|uniref:Uncharacterized protein n=1 Tax=Diphasiastrum complanatum TaxID=34168 RepID=A0ACC2BB25_DIPCM|nr:hypothetical protein O6H91_16G030100 [Diphasiastrum complanatum]